MNRLLLVFLSVIPFLLSAQTRVNKGFKDSDEIVEHLSVDNDQLRSYIYQVLPEELTTEINNRKAFQFADESAYFVTDLLRSGQVYNGWNAMDQYLNAVLQEVVPDEMKNEPYLKAYIIKEGSLNAFMTPSGQFFVHVGLFDMLETESELASIIAHEVAHFTQHHSAKGFVKRETENFGIREKRLSRFSIENELESDSLAMSYMLNSKYDPSAVVSAMKIFERNSEKTLLKYQRLWSIPETTHPSSDRRVNTLKRILEGITEDLSDRSHFAISQAGFRQLKYLAQAEILKYMMDDFQYDDLIEKAFKYHLFEPENPTYIYYLMEGIRRSCYLDQGNWNKNFITYRYHEIEGKGDKKKKVPVTDHLFEEFNPIYFDLTKESWEKLKGQFYWQGDVKFRTHEEAFNFFYRIGELVNEPECYLSNALSLHFDKEKQNAYLEKYLESEKILHREYAEALLNNKIHESLADKRLTVFNQFFPIVRQGDNEVLVWNGDESKKKLLTDKVEEVIQEFPDRSFLFLPDMKKNRLNLYKTLNALNAFANGRLVSKGEKTELHILAPLYWEIFNEFQVNEIEFLNSRYYEVRKSDDELESYKGIVDTSYDELLSIEKKSGRYIDIIYSSIRMIEGENMKKRYMGDQAKLNMKESAFAQFQSVLKSKLDLIENLED